MAEAGGMRCRHSKIDILSIDFAIFRDLLFDTIFLSIFATDGGPNA